MTADPVIRAQGLDLVFQTDDGPVHALRDVDLTINRGEFVSVIGTPGIRINNILSGVIDPIDQPPERHAGAGLRRIGRVADATPLAAFPCGDRASCITDHNIRMDGRLARSP